MNRRKFITSGLVGTGIAGALTPSTGLPQRELIPPQIDASGATKFGFETREDDWPTVAADKQGRVWAAWVSSRDLEDQILLRKNENDQWQGYIRVPGVSGDVWRPKLCVDGSNSVWVVWSQSMDGNWDIYATRFDGEKWDGPMRLTDDPEPDLNVDVKADEFGRLWAVWQGFRNGQSDIYLRIHQAGEWGPTVKITSGPANDWEPALALDSTGTAHIVWDTYRNGNYDIYMRSINGEGRFLSPELPVTSSPLFEAHASVACDKQDRIWIAWEEAGVNWGKDTGYWIHETEPGTPLGGPRSIRVRCIVGGVAKEPVADLRASMPEGQQTDLLSPRLVIDKQDRLWLLFRHRVQEPPSEVGPKVAPVSSSYWQTYSTRLEGNRWTPAITLPHSRNRISAFADLTVTDNGRIWAVYSTDGRRLPNYHVPIKNDVYAYSIQYLGRGQAAEPVLREASTPVINARPTDPKEKANVADIRSYRVTIGGASYQIVRGDLHRHTELSWDLGGSRDGSLLDYYRYMLDVAAMDFGAVTDHLAGGDLSLAYTEKTADLFHLPGKYESLFGYERSVAYPNGHRNVFHELRGVRVVKLFLKNFAGEDGISTERYNPGEVVENDTQLLYRSLRRTHGIAIPHTSATDSMGTDWRDHDHEVEPVVEIYQGCRTSSECAGSPRATDAQHAPGGFAAAGYVWNAWNKGYRLGVIASSDHLSTHISYAMVYTNDFSRRGILEAIRQRRTYGATDNIILEFWADNHFMGEEFGAKQPVTFTAKVVGTAPIARIHLIKDSKYIHSTVPKAQKADISFRDNEVRPGLSWYYVRVEQEDGEIAWSSPIWVNFEK